MLPWCSASSRVHQWLDGGTLNMNQQFKKFKYHLTIYFYHAWLAVFSSNTVCSARVLPIVVAISFIDHQWTIFLNFVLSPVGNLLAIFCPRDSWCWHAAGWTLNGDACFGECCHVIADNYCNRTEMMSLYCLWFIGCSNARFWVLYEKDMNDIRNSSIQADDNEWLMNFTIT